ncbi:hypothetical protein PO909_014213 [Leuciscus waleckii]
MTLQIADSWQMAHLLLNRKKQEELENSLSHTALIKVSGEMKLEGRRPKSSRGQTVPVGTMMARHCAAPGDPMPTPRRSQPSLEEETRGAPLGQAHAAYATKAANRLRAVDNKRQNILIGPAGFYGENKCTSWALGTRQSEEPGQREKGLIIEVSRWFSNPSRKRFIMTVSVQQIAAQAHSTSFHFPCNI